MIHNGIELLPQKERWYWLNEFLALRFPAHYYYYYHSGNVVDEASSGAIRAHPSVIHPEQKCLLPLNIDAICPILRLVCFFFPFPYIPAIRIFSLWCRLLPCTAQLRLCCCRDRENVIIGTINDSRLLMLLLRGSLVRLLSRNNESRSFKFSWTSRFLLFFFSDDINRFHKLPWGRYVRTLGHVCSVGAWSRSPG